MSYQYLKNILSSKYKLALQLIWYYQYDIQFSQITCHGKQNEFFGRMCDLSDSVCDICHCLLENHSKYNKQKLWLQNAASKENMSYVGKFSSFVHKKLFDMFGRMGLGRAAKDFDKRFIKSKRFFLQSLQKSSSNCNSW